MSGRDSLQVHPSPDWTIPLGPSRETPRSALLARTDRERDDPLPSLRPSTRFDFAPRRTTGVPCGHSRNRPLNAGRHTICRQFPADQCRLPCGDARLSYLLFDAPDLTAAPVSRRPPRDREVPEAKLTQRRLMTSTLPPSTRAPSSVLARWGGGSLAAAPSDAYTSTMNEPPLPRAKKMDDRGLVGTDHQARVRSWPPPAQSCSAILTPPKYRVKGVRESCCLNAPRVLRRGANTCREDDSRRVDGATWCGRSERTARIAAASGACP
jgi:hypothetical protein